MLGFHRPGRFDLIDDVTEDILASERVDELREAVKAWCRGRGCRPGTGAASRGCCATSSCARGGARASSRRAWSRAPARASAWTSSRPPRPPTGSSGPAPRAWRRPRATARPRSSRATAHLEEELAGLRFRISPDAFFQTNTEMAERLYGSAVELAGLTGRERVLDLFCGIGTIALVLALDAGEVWGVEIVEEAVADAIENARLNGVDNAHFFAGDVRLAMRPLLEKSGRPDVVVVDPPRAGLSQKVVRRVLEAEAKRIVYVSCNPTTLAPNARQMADAGYELKTVRPVDMFPQTPHIECVAHAGAPPSPPAAARPRRARPPRSRAPCTGTGRRSPATAWISALVSSAPHSAQRRSITGSTPSCSSSSTSSRFLRHGSPAARWPPRPCAAGPRAATSRSSAAGWRRSARRTR